MGLPEPRTRHQHEELFNRIGLLPSFNNKGPQCKLMRWFSFLECTKYYKGQLWALKMILEHHFSKSTDSYEEAPEPVQLPMHEKDPKEQLRKLKGELGALRLSVKVITEENLWVLDLIYEVSLSSWYTYGVRARTIKTPQQSVGEALADSDGKWQDELVQLVARCMTGTSNRDCFHNLSLMDNSWEDQLDKTHKLTDLVMHIIYYRCRSQATMQSLPPHRQA